MKKLNLTTRIITLRRSYLTALTLIICLIVGIFITRTADFEESKSESYVSVDKQWTLTPGGEDYIDIKDLGQYFKDGSDTLSIYWQIPEIEYDKNLIFRSKDVYCNAYINGDLVYSTQKYDSPFYTASPGNNWNFFNITPNESGNVVELQIKYVYDTSAVTVDHFYWGNKSDWVLDFLMSKTLAIILSGLIIFIGIIIMSMNHSAYKKSGKHSLLYLGIYAILMGMWSLLETNTLQIVTNDGRLIQLLDNFLMITDSLPLFFYLDAEFDILKHRDLRVLTIADIAYILFCVIGQFTGLIDIHNFLAGSWIATGFSFIILIGILVQQVIAFMRGGQIKRSVIIQIFGFVALMIIVIISLPIFINSDGMDRAESIRFGMLVMVIMFAIAGQLKTYELIKQGTRYEIVKNLAYQDALTGLRNRTSYLEALEEYRLNPPEGLGVIFFDVNNLKYANDNFGHDMGDQLICAAANTIKDSFIDYGTAYRNGGDEFIVILSGSDPTSLYKAGLETFEKKLDALNHLNNYPFKIEIAHGFAIREVVDDEHLKQMVEEADRRMYENKRYLKSKG